MAFILTDRIPLLVFFAFVLAVVSAAGVLPLMVLAARRKAVAMKRSAWDRLARQLTYPMLVSAGVMIVLGAVAFIYRHELFAAMDAHAFFAHSVAALCLMNIVAGCLLSMPYFLVRRAGTVNSGTGVATGLGFVAAWCALVGWMVIAFTVLLADVFPNLFLPGQLADTVLKWPAVWLMVILWAVCAASATAGGLALVTQIVRRERDDYGRDYYMLTARWCARWARWGALGSALTAGLWAWQLYPVPGYLWYYAAAVVVFSLVAMLTWNTVAAAENPLRFKTFMLVGGGCMIMALASVQALYRAGQILIGQP